MEKAIEPLPKASVMRLIKRAQQRYNSLHTDRKLEVSDGALNDIMKHAHEFITFVTSEANDKCQREQRKTITGDDIVSSLESLGFENYYQLLSIYSQKLKETKLEKLKSVETR